MSGRVYVLVPFTTVEQAQKAQMRIPFTSRIGRDAALDAEYERLVLIHVEEETAASQEASR